MNLGQFKQNLLCCLNLPRHRSCWLMAQGPSSDIINITPIPVDKRSECPLTSPSLGAGGGHCCGLRCANRPADNSEPELWNCKTKWPKGGRGRGLGITLPKPELHYYGTGAEVVKTRGMQKYSKTSVYRPNKRCAGCSSGRLPPPRVNVAVRK